VAKSAAVTVKGSLVTASGNELLFDERPVDIGGFRLLGRSIEPVGRPTIKGFQMALAFACEAHESSPYWVGGLIAYADNRADWRDKLSQAMTVTGLAEQTLHNLGYVYRHTTDQVRALAPTPKHAAEVAPLATADQVEWLEKAKTEGWNAGELRRALRYAKRRKVLEGQAVLAGRYRVLEVDCPWPYRDRPPSGSGSDENFPTMTIEELCALPIAAHTTEDAAMGFWVPAPLLYDPCGSDSEIPGPLQVIRAWGFEPKAQMIWDKQEHNYGHYVSVRHELFIICTRGSCTPDRLTPMLDSIISVKPPSRAHSAKPPDFRQALMRLCDGPYLQLFASEPVEGWTCWGNDARLWPAEGVMV
jgi:N6-adenosine-specific RNA methylase IME4